MAFRKRYVPRGLEGRAALILLLPVVVLQVGVSVVFIQRHFEDVTTQMTQTMARELRLVLTTAEAAADREAALEDIARFAGELGLDVRFPVSADIPARDLIRWYDFSGRVMIGVLHERFPTLGPVLLPDNRSVTVYLGSTLGPLEIGFARRRVSASNPHQLLVNMAFFGGLMTVIAYLYLRNQLRPITRLAQAAQAFGRGRHVPYAPSGAVEVRAAGNAFLDMRARIERAIEQRTMMLSGVSHDLRTPLTRLKLGLSMLDEDEAAPLLRDVDEMQRMIDAFLAFSRGAVEGESEDVDPAGLVREIVEDARRGGTEVSLTEVTGSGRVALRRMPVRRALENLIGNAVRYGSRAEVSVILTDRSLCLRVEDDGPGIPTDQREQAVKPFTRLDPARNQDLGGGVGLGLAIAADIARAHGGVLRLDRSDRLGGLRADIVIGR